MVRDASLRDLLAVAESADRAGNLRAAAAAYHDVLRLTQDGEYERALAHVRLAGIHLRLDRPGRALPHLRRARALSGPETELDLMLARALIALGRGEDALPFLIDAAAHPVHASTALARLAECAAADGDRRRAGHLARLAVDRAPESPEYAALARALADA